MMDRGTRGDRGTGDGRRRTILIVEDEPANVDLFRAVMRRAPEPVVRDARLLEAGTLADARRLVAEESVDLVLLDVRLPDGVGLDLARELREDAGPARRRDPQRQRAAVGA